MGGLPVFNGCGVAIEILSSLFQGPVAVSKSVLSHSPVALPGSSLFTPDTPGTIIATPPPNSLAWERCVHKPCHVGSSPLFFFSKSRVRPPNPRPQPSGSWGREGEPGAAGPGRPTPPAHSGSLGQGMAPYAPDLTSWRSKTSSSTTTHMAWVCFSH